MLYRTRGALPIWDCNGKTISEGDVLDYKNPKFDKWSDFLHKVVWSAEKNCYCLMRLMDGEDILLAEPEKEKLMRIGHKGRWRPERWKIVKTLSGLPQP